MRPFQDDATRHGLLLAAIAAGQPLAPRSHTKGVQGGVTPLAVLPDGKFVRIRSERTKGERVISVKALINNYVLPGYESRHTSATSAPAEAPAEAPAAPANEARQPSLFVASADASRPIAIDSLTYARLEALAARQRAAFEGDDTTAEQLAGRLLRRAVQLLGQPADTFAAAAQ